MDTNTDNNETPKRRIEDKTPAETIAWDKPGAPAVPAAPQAQSCAALRHVASMVVNAGGVSVFPTPAADLLEHGHYMLSAPGAQLTASAAPSKIAEPTPAATSGDAPDLQLLKALATRANAESWLASPTDTGEWVVAVQRESIALDVAHICAGNDFGETEARFIAAASPAVVLDLIARIERAAAPQAEKVECMECNGTGEMFGGFGCTDCNGKGYHWEPVERAAAPAPADDEMWDKAIAAEAKANQLQRENEDLRAALKAISENPARCVSIADAVLLNCK